MFDRHSWVGFCKLKTRCAHATATIKNKPKDLFPETPSLENNRHAIVRYIVLATEALPKR